MLKMLAIICSKSTEQLGTLEFSMLCLYLEVYKIEFFFLGINIHVIVLQVMWKFMREKVLVDCPLLALLSKSQYQSFIE